MKQFHERFGEQVQFVDIVVRQAHPGERRGPYRDADAKRKDAGEYKRAETIPWPVLIDDLAGTVHRAYGGMSDPVYLIDAEGRVVFYNMWANAPSLSTALVELLLPSGPDAVVSGGIDRVPHMAASFVNGWHGLRRGGWGAVLDFELATPGATTLTFLGHLAKPLLAPIAMRSTPLPPTTKAIFVGGITAATVLAIRLRRRA